MTPASLPELTDMVRAHPRVLAVGALTKPRLSQVDAAKISMTKLSGLVEYEPSEFTFTALAGTPLRDIAATLAASGQYLPFDPMLLDAGATLGGTIASGLNGPGRFRYGGLRDFILGVLFVDGEGRLLRLGGRVVKNAAGFDLPKFLVGSLGRFGILAEITMKVFPRPAATITLRLKTPDPARLLIEAASTRWEPQALDLLPDGNICLRLAGPPAALEKIAEQILARWPGEILPDAESLWTNLREFHWAHESLIKVALTPDLLPSLDKNARLHATAGGHAAFLSFPSGPATWNKNLRGLTLRGPGPLWRGPMTNFTIEKSVKAVLDPVNRFPGLHD